MHRVNKCNLWTGSLTGLVEDGAESSKQNIEEGWGGEDGGGGGGGESQAMNLSEAWISSVCQTRATSIGL